MANQTLTETNHATSVARRASDLAAANRLGDISRYRELLRRVASNSDEAALDELVRVGAALGVKPELIDQDVAAVKDDIRLELEATEAQKKIADAHSRLPAAEARLKKFEEEIRPQLEKLKSDVNALAYTLNFGHHAETRLFQHRDSHLRAFGETEEGFPKLDTEAPTSASIVRRTVMANYPRTYRGGVIY